MEHVANAIPGVISGILLMIVGYAWQKLKDYKKERDEEVHERRVMLEALVAATRDQLRYRILKLHDCIISKGFVTRDELEVLKALYESYVALGGNSFIVERYEFIINNIPVREQ